MKNLLIVVLLLSMLSFGCAAAMVGVGAGMAISAADKAKMKENWITRTYPHEETELWQKTLLVCQERAYSVEIHDKANGYIETDWKTQKYSDSPDFPHKIKQYGVPIDAGDIKWDGMRYRLLIFMVQVKPTETNLRIRADLRGRSSSGSGIWRWWNSNGTLEDMFLTHLETRLGYAPEVSEE